MPNDAGAPIVGYVVKYKLVEEASYQELLSNYNQLSYKITQDVIEGALYMFIAKSFNKWGLAEKWSEPTTILAATVPQIVTEVQSMIEPLTGGL